MSGLPTQPIRRPVTWERSRRPAPHSLIDRSVECKEGHNHGDVSRSGDSGQPPCSAIRTPYKKERCGGHQCTDLSRTAEEWPPASVDVLVHGQPQPAVSGELIW